MTLISCHLRLGGGREKREGEIEGAEGGREGGREGGEGNGREQSEISASSTQHAASSPGPGGQWLLTGQTKSGVNGVTDQLQ